ncbi:hypothetical protein M2135_002866 [Parabacteroides sp. PF5-9]|nr:hypothetical protein [Parabacteroides sp. PF5-9]
MLKTILSVSGKPGLFKLISQGKNMLIVESLTDKKRTPVYASDKVISLGDIAIYTEEEEVPLHQVLESIKKKEASAAISLTPSALSPQELRDYFAAILPNFDRERVYPSDIKKILNWYNTLIANNITDFTPEKAAEQEVAEEQKSVEAETAPKTEKPEKKTTKKTAKKTETAETTKTPKAPKEKTTKTTKTTKKKEE